MDTTTEKRETKNGSEKFLAHLNKANEGTVRDLSREELEKSYIMQSNRATKLQMILDNILYSISSATSGKLMKDYHLQLSLKHNPDFKLDF
jgi:hypothetical protein